MKFNKEKCKIHSSILRQEQSDVQIRDVKQPVEKDLEQL